MELRTDGAWYQVSPWALCWDDEKYYLVAYDAGDDKIKHYRVDKMLEAGLLDEVKALKEMGYTRDMVAMKGLGYKEVLDFFSGEITLDEAIYRVKRDSRHFDKRQLTWFRRERDVTWVNLDGREEAEVLEELVEKLRANGIIKKSDC